MQLVVSKRQPREHELERIYNMEEIYWQQRGNALRILKGDANTDFFHAYANGRRRKKAIIELETDHGVVRTQEDIMEHVTNFYKSLFGSQPRCSLSLTNDFWADQRTLTVEEKESLVRPFLEEEVKLGLLSMKADSAPGPNGFGVHFLKLFGL